MSAKLRYQSCEAENSSDKTECPTRSGRATLGGMGQQHRTGRPCSLLLAPLLCSLACGTTPPLATSPPPPAESRSEPHRPGEPVPEPTEPTQSAVPPTPSPDVTDAHGELERAFGNKKALATLFGETSYYSDALAGRKTASGERYDPRAYTAAHRSLPFGTVLRVRRKDTGDVVYVRVNDRGPFGKRRRILDLSKAAAQQLGIIRRGIADVHIEIVARPEKKR